MNRKLTPEEAKEFEQIQKAYQDAVQVKKEWLDRMMLETSDVKPGDLLFIHDRNARYPRIVGVVTELYRHWAEQGRPDLDNSQTCDYAYQTGSNTFDNTSRQNGVSFCGVDYIIHNYGKQATRDAVAQFVHQHGTWNLDGLLKVLDEKLG